MPAAAREIEAELHSQRLTSGLFRLEGVIKAAELLGKSLPFSITEVREERLVHARDIPSAARIVRIADRVVSRWGMATISDVVAEVRKLESGVCDRNLVTSALACVGGIHWLEQSAGWFWLPDNRNNPLLNRIRKILSVANQIDISKLRATIGRDYDIKGLSPPKRVLLEFCRQAPGLRVEDQTVKAEPGVSSDDVLAQAGAIMKRSKLTLESELRDHLLGTGRNARVAARYYGFDGRGGGTLQSVGDEIGVTRERVRQIMAAASQGLGTGRPVSLMLDRTIAFVVDRMPAAAGEIEAELQFQQLTARLFRLEGVIKAAELLGRRLPFSITEVNGERLVHGRDIPSVDTIVRIARRVISRWGMATLSDVVAEVRKVESGVCDRELVGHALACLGGFHWLGQSTDWFWLSNNPNNPVLNRMRKILSVASPINISELWAGIGRDYRMKKLSPPKSVLLEFCRQAPGLRVNHETVKAVPGVNSDDILSGTERDIVHLLSEHGGTITPSELTSVCLGMGVNRRTCYRNLVSSPIISRYADGLYGLIGSGKRSGRGARLQMAEARTSEASGSSLPEAPRAKQRDDCRELLLGPARPSIGVKPVTILC
jgi:hypothetical protein